MDRSHSRRVSRETMDDQKSNGANVIKSKFELVQSTSQNFFARSCKVFQTRKYTRKPDGAEEVTRNGFLTRSGFVHLQHGAVVFQSFGSRRLLSVILISSAASKMRTIWMKKNLQTEESFAGSVRMKRQSCILRGGVKENAFLLRLLLGACSLYFGCPKWTCSLIFGCLKRQFTLWLIWQCSGFSSLNPRVNFGMA